MLVLGLEALLNHARPMLQADLRAGEERLQLREEPLMIEGLPLLHASGYQLLKLELLL